jgi:hypothetical protein
VDDITPQEMARGIRWIQEKLVFFALGLAFVASILSAVAVTASVFIIVQSGRVMENTQDEMEVYEIYITQLDARLRSMGFEPPELPKKAEEKE